MANKLDLVPIEVIDVHCAAGNDRVFASVWLEPGSDQRARLRVKGSRWQLEGQMVQLIPLLHT